VGVDAMIILKWISGGYTEQWIHLAQDEVRWWMFVNTVMNIPVSYKN
jgi:hypothetical protein